MRTVRGSESALRGESEARCGARGPEAAFPKEKATTGRSAFYFLGPQRSRSSVGWACPPCAHPRGDPAGPKSAPGHVRRQRALCTGTRHAPAAREAQGNRHPPPPQHASLTWSSRTGTKGLGPSGLGPARRALGRSALRVQLRTRRSSRSGRSRSRHRPAPGRPRTPAPSGEGGSDALARAPRFAHGRGRVRGCSQRPRPSVATTNLQRNGAGRSARWPRGPRCTASASAAWCPS